MEESRKRKRKSSLSVEVYLPALKQHTANSFKQSLTFPQASTKPPLKGPSFIHELLSSFGTISTYIINQPEYIRSSANAKYHRRAYKVARAKVNFNPGRRLK